MRRLLSLLIVLTFAARSILPAGTMLVPASGDGLGPTFVICTGSGPMTVEFDADGKPVPAKPAQADHGICAFTASVHAAVAPGTYTEIPQTQWLTVAVIKPATANADVRSAQAAPPPARGPPSLS